MDVKKIGDLKMFYNYQLTFKLNRMVDIAWMFIFMMVESIKSFKRYGKIKLLVYTLIHIGKIKLKMRIPLSFSGV